MTFNRVYLVDWLPPVFGATGQYILKYAREYAAQSGSVAVVGLSTNSSSRSIEFEGRLLIQRIKRSPVNKDSFFSRIFWAFNSNILLLLHALRFLKKADEVVITGSPPFMIFLIVPLKVVFRFKLIYRITDFYPECVFAAVGDKAIYKSMLISVTNFFRRRADLIEVLGNDQAKRLRNYGFKDSQLSLVRDDVPIEFVPGLVDPIMDDELNGRIVVLYSGNWGVAHDVDTFVDAFINASRVNKDLYLWINSNSPVARGVFDRLQSKQVDCRLTPTAPLEQLPSILCRADIHLITLKTSFWGYVMPSKVYACLQSDRSILYIGPPESDVFSLCSDRFEELGKFRHFDIGDSAGVERFLTRFVAK